MLRLSYPIAAIASVCLTLGCETAPPEHHRPPAQLRMRSGIVYGFHSHVSIDLLGGFRFRVGKVLRYTDLRGVTYEVPEDFVTDFASSRIGQYTFLPWQFTVSESAVLHDY